MQLETRYAWNGEISLAYQLLGEGPVDLVYLQGYLSNVELNWEHPACARFLRELARFSRLVVSDRRGLGCSERFTPADTPPLELLMGDVLAVLDAAGCERAVLFASGDCGPIACLSAAAYPERVAALVLYGTAPTWNYSEETPWGASTEGHEEEARAIRDRFGDGSWLCAHAPSVIRGERDFAWAGRYERLSLTPGSVYWEGKRFAETDVRGVLSSIHIPTLVLHRRDDPEEAVEAGRYLAARIPSAHHKELPGVDHFPWAGSQEDVLQALEGFLTTLRAEEAELDRLLSTVLFTDIVGSTEKTAEVGDPAWRDLLLRHDASVRALLARYRGKEINTTGDGFLASFDGPVRALRCAEAIVKAVKPLGLEIRAGLHTGEVERAGDQLTGLAVDIGARVASLAEASEVLVSQTVKDLVAGSGFVFEDRGLYELKGVPDEWRLFVLVRHRHTTATAPRERLSIGSPF